MLSYLGFEAYDPQTCISTRMPMMLMEVASMAVRIFMMVMMMGYLLIIANDMFSALVYWLRLSKRLVMSSLLHLQASKTLQLKLSWLIGMHMR